MKFNWKMYLFFIVPNLEAASKMIASSDENTTGTDDRIAQFLHWTYLGMNAILNDQPIPAVPVALTGGIAEGDVAGALRVLAEHHKTSVVTHSPVERQSFTNFNRETKSGETFAEGLARREKEILANRGSIVSLEFDEVSADAEVDTAPPSAVVK
jgi:hypothetical protein